MAGQLKERLQTIAPEIKVDPSRLAQEVALLADRVDITEELVRLRSHISEVQSTLGVSPNGRKLEFLVQEVGREFNTVGSKAQCAAIQKLVVEAKVELERIREQILNLE